MRSFLIICMSVMIVTISRDAAGTLSAAAKGKKKAKTTKARGQPSEAFTGLWNAAPACQEPTVASIITKKRKLKATRPDLSRDHRRGEFLRVPAEYKGIHTNFSQFKKLCTLYDTKQIKIPEMRKLVYAGKIDVS